MAAGSAMRLITYYTEYNGKYITDFHVTDYSTNVYDEYINAGNTIPVKDGYYFIGWSQYINGNAEIISPDTPLSSMTMNDYGYSGDGEGGYIVYAVWEQSAPTIIFNSTTGTFSDSTTTKSVQVSLDGTVSLSNLVEFPIKQSYVFKGWSTTENGSIVYIPYATPTITEDATLYAVWEEAESYLIRQDTLVNIANAVRSKTGGTDAIALGDMATIIAALGPTISASGDTLTITN